MSNSKDFFAPVSKKTLAYYIAWGAINLAAWLGNGLETEGDRWFPAPFTDDWYEDGLDWGSYDVTEFLFYVGVPFVIFVIYRLIELDKSR